MDVSLSPINITKVGLVIEENFNIVGISRLKSLSSLTLLTYKFFSNGQNDSLLRFFFTEVIFVVYDC